MPRRSSRRSHSGRSAPRFAFGSCANTEESASVTPSGRHLLNILRATRALSALALAWIFPLPWRNCFHKVGQRLSQYRVFIREHRNDVGASAAAISRSRCLAPFHTTTTVKALTPRKIDNYYVEPLGNGVPRERIFEIWKLSDRNKSRMFGRTVSIVEAGAKRYGNVLKAHTWAIASITARRLRADFEGLYRGQCARAFDVHSHRTFGSCLRFANFGIGGPRLLAAVARTEGQHALITRAEWL